MGAEERRGFESDQRVFHEGRSCLMKFLILSVLMAFQFFAFASQSVCQEPKAQPDRPYLKHTEAPRLHFTIHRADGTGWAQLVASSAQRDLSDTQTESILQLAGNVEVRMVTCGPTGQHGPVVCDAGSMVLHADAVDYNETTGEIVEAHGNVHIVPYRIPRPR
jgi:lipopolysaccharide assembly outer membrane protein LptD (OstA)